MKLDLYSFWLGIGFVFTAAAFLIMVFGIASYACADELPFKTHEWTDGHGRVCTATLHEYLDPQDAWWTDIESGTNCMQFKEGVATPCEPTYITRVDTLDCDWPPEGWGTSYPVQSLEDPLILELLK